MDAVDVLKFNVHGSHDSLDVDVVVAVDEHWAQPTIKPHMLVAECTRLAGPVADALGVPVALVNCNLVVVRDGVIAWVAKGDNTETNNALLCTYALHVQRWPPFATRALQRNVNAKLHRGVRSALGAFTRTNHRAAVKAALRSAVVFGERVRVLSELDVAHVQWEASVVPAEELKRAAFQTAQMWHLLHRDVELFTKAAVADASPALAVFMRREPASPQDMAQLQAAVRELCAALEARMAAGSIERDALELRDHGSTGGNGVAVAQ